MAAGPPRVVVLDHGVPEHEQALSLVAVVAGPAWLFLLSDPRPIIALVPDGWGWPVDVWAAMLTVGGVATLAAAVRFLRRVALADMLRIEQAGQIIQATMWAAYAIGALMIAPRGWIGSIIFGGWAAACSVRAWRLQQNRWKVG